MPASHTDDALYVYGAGTVGRELLAHWRAHGHEPAAFIDRAFDRIHDLDGVPVIALDQADATAASHVVVALHSPGAAVADVVDDLARRGFGSVETLWSACHRERWLPDVGYWLSPFLDRGAESASIAAVRALLLDEFSVRVFDTQVALRLAGDYRALTPPTRADQYRPDDLPRWVEPMRLVDCGAYDGDTIVDLMDAGYRVDGCIAFEPDPANFAKLAERFRDTPSIRAIQAGAHSAPGTLSFAAGAGPAARVDAAGPSSIAVTTIDAECAAFDPTLIKIDIEGAERDALEGAAATIRRCLPALAIAVYHRADDLWRLPLLIHSFDARYRFHLRTHAHCGFETVLYAVANR